MVCTALRAIATMACAALSLAACAGEAPPPIAAKEIDPAKVAALVAQLGDQDFAKRETAERALCEFGHSAKLWQLLFAALEREKDQEVASRLRRILPLADPGNSKHWPDDLISLDVTEMSLREVAARLSQESKKNILIKRKKDEELPITVKLQHTTCRNILRFVARKYGLRIDERLVEHGIVYVSATAKVSMDFRGVAAREVFNTIAEQGEVNVILGPEVKGTVTTRLENIPAEDALSAVAKSLDFAAVREKGSLWRVNAPHVPPPEDKPARANVPAADGVRISLEVGDRPLATVLDYLSGVSKLKITTKKGLEKVLVGFELKNVTCRAILEHLVETYGLEIDDSVAGAIVLNKPPSCSMQFNNADIRDVINTIAFHSDSKIILHADVRGTLSMRLENVVWSDALSAAARALGCVAERQEDGTWRVRSAGK